MCGVISWEELTRSRGLKGRKRDGGGGWEHKGGECYEGSNKRGPRLSPLAFHAPHDRLCLREVLLHANLDCVVPLYPHPRTHGRQFFLGQ